MGSVFDIGIITVRAQLSVNFHRLVLLGKEPRSCFSLSPLKLTHRNRPSYTSWRIKCVYTNCLQLNVCNVLGNKLLTSVFVSLS